MKKDMVRFAAILPALLILLIPASFADARDPGEAAKIEYLIKSVEDLHGVKFIRNGSEYDSKKAADHLRLKLGKAGPRVKTAEDFITLCGSRSYLSGKPYMMRFPDGTAVTAESFFRRKLKEYK
ncbi:MAG: DUF5329 family protein [Syntrophaceae bacterium]